MKAVIIAAGKAPRLLPLSKDTPQCLLDINGKTILERQTELLNKAGVKDITIVTGYLAEKVEEFCKEKGIKTLFNPFYDVSGIALTLWIAKDKLKNGCVFLYSDILFDSKIIANLMEQKGDICIVIKKDNIREEAEKVVEENGMVKSISKEHMTGETGEFIGIAKFSSEGAEKLIKELNEIARVNINSTLIETLAKLIEKGEEVTAYNIQKGALFVDIDFPADLKVAEELFKPNFQRF